MSAAQVDPHDKMRARDVNKVARGEQAPRPAHEFGTVSPPPPPSLTLSLFFFAILPSHIYYYYYYFINFEFNRITILLYLNPNTKQINLFYIII